MSLLRGPIPPLPPMPPTRNTTLAECIQDLNTLCDANPSARHSFAYLRLLHWLTDRSTVAAAGAPE